MVLSNVGVRKGVLSGDEMASYSCSSCLAVTSLHAHTLQYLAETKPCEETARHTWHLDCSSRGSWQGCLLLIQVGNFEVVRVGYNQEHTDIQGFPHWHLEYNLL